MSVPSVFGLPHLSEDAVAAFADGVLAPAAAARAGRHCQECRECAEAVLGQREAVLLLRSAMAPSLPMGLLDRLAGLPMSAELPPPSSGLPTAIGSDGRPVFVAYRPPSSDDFDSGRRAEESVADADPHRHGWPVARRAAFPIGLIASAAAVVAAGTLGGQVQSFTNTPGSAANLSGAVSQTETQRSGRGGAQPLGLMTGTRDTSAVGSGAQGGSAMLGQVGPVAQHLPGRMIAQP